MDLCNLCCLRIKKKKKDWIFSDNSSCNCLLQILTWHTQKQTHFLIYIWLVCFLTCLFLKMSNCSVSIPGFLPSTWWGVIWSDPLYSWHVCYESSWNVMLSQFGLMFRADVKILVSFRLLMGNNRGAENSLCLPSHDWTAMLKQNVHYNVKLCWNYLFPESISGSFPIFDFCCCFRYLFHSIYTQAQQHLHLPMNDLDWLGCPIIEFRFFSSDAVTETPSSHFPACFSWQLPRVGHAQVKRTWQHTRVIHHDNDPCKNIFQI